MSLINRTMHIYAYFYIFLLCLLFVTSTSEIALTYSFYHGYVTDACLFYILNDICVATDLDVYYYFCSSVETSSPLKVLSFIELL